MFVYNRSAFTVILPLAMLVAVAWWSNHSPVTVAPRLEMQQAVVEPAREVVAERQPARQAREPAG